MARLEVYEFIPGAVAEITMTVKNTNVASAQLVSKLNQTDEDVVSDKTITPTVGVHGQVVYADPDSELTFTFTGVETALYSPMAPYYVFDVEVIEAVTAKPFRLGISKICPQPSTF